MNSGTILSVQGLTVDFLSDEEPVRAVDNVSFAVAAGETLCILGESGSGKSVSSSTILDILDRPPADIVAGSITFEGRDLGTMSASERREINGRRIAMIFQDPLAHLNPVQTIGEQICEVFEVHGECHGDEARRRAIVLLGHVGIPEPESRFGQYPHQFSGGQRQRIMIAMALALSPRLLIADEPTTALDVSVQAQILDLLRNLQHEYGMALILITHDLEVAASMADRVIVMKAGKIVEEGKARTVFTNPQHEYTQRLIHALPSASELQPHTSPPDGPILLEVNNLTKTYQLPRSPFGRAGSLLAVDKASFNLREGETVGIVGESGSGKSTIARMLLRLNQASGGEALYRGHDIFKMDDREMLRLRRRVQMVFQDPFASMNPRMDVFTIISEPWVIHKDILPKAQWRDRVAELLGLVGLNPDWMQRHIHQFSGGQRQRIAIARALASEPELIVCDEAVSALDVSIQMQVIELLADLQQRLKLSYLFITHDLPIVRHFADRIIVMRRGEIVEQGEVEQIFTAPRHEYTKTLLSAVPRPKWELA